MSRSLALAGIALIAASIVTGCRGATMAPLADGDDPGVRYGQMWHGDGHYPGVPRGRILRPGIQHGRILRPDIQRGRILRPGLQRGRMWRGEAPDPGIRSRDVTPRAPVIRRPPSHRLRPGCTRIPGGMSCSSSQGYNRGWDFNDGNDPELKRALEE